MGAETTKKSSLYSPELAETILRRLAGGESLLAISKDPTMPSRTTMGLWVTNDIDGWASKYKRARRLLADVYVERTIENAEEGLEEIQDLPDPRVASGFGGLKKELNASLRWAASRMHPNAWGDRSQVDVSALVSVLAPEEIKKPRTSGLGVSQAAVSAGKGKGKAVETR